jgi:hypothetical protein
MSEEVRQAILETIESALDAQLRAVRKLRRGEPAETKQGAPRSRRSQVSIVEDILAEAGQPLHISTIIERAKSRFGQNLDRESLVSALTKRIKRKDRLVRNAPNTFGLRPSKGGTSCYLKSSSFYSMIFVRSFPSNGSLSESVVRLWECFAR